MKIETLKQLIKREINLSEDNQDLEVAIMDLLDLFEADNNPSVSPLRHGAPSPWITPNPYVGDSGICGCTIANKIVSSDNGAFSGNWNVTTTYDGKTKTA